MSSASCSRSMISRIWSACRAPPCSSRASASARGDDASRHALRTARRNCPSSAAGAGTRRTSDSPSIFRDDASSMPVRRAAALNSAGAERADQVAQVGLVDRVGGLGEREPAALALVLFLPARQARRSPPAGTRRRRPSARRRCRGACDSGSCRAGSGRPRRSRRPLPRPRARRRRAASAPVAEIALGNHPAPGLARGDQQDAHGRIRARCLRCDRARRRSGEWFVRRRDDHTPGSRRTDEPGGS